MLHFCPEQNSIQAVYTVCCRIVSNPVTVLYENVFRNKKNEREVIRFCQYIITFPECNFIPTLLSKVFVYLTSNSNTYRSLNIWDLF